ncbi:M1 family aminopeptidase [Sphingomicrobium sp. XHP0239]|uniref:ABC transporter permease/M1 family aminopeptidase n=1 Tax=Sphingomicrobium maritimum TaxID=3133972 RepID=UPI0031CC7A38
MIAKIAAFELRYHLSSPTFWVGSVIFFMLGFGLTASDTVQINAGGQMYENSPWALSLLTGISTIFYLMVITAFVANSIVRDDQTKFAPMIRATPVTKYQMLLGRFGGGVAVAAVGFIPVLLGAFIGTLMPWVDPETIGPQKFAYYGWPYLTLALPNVILASAFLFMLATLTRSMLWSYVGVVIFVVGYLVVSGLAGSNPDLRELFARFEPLGTGAFVETTRYWTASEQNTRLIQLEGLFGFNRVFVLLLAAAFFAVTLWRFSFADKPASKRQLKKLAKRKRKEEQLAAIEPTLGGARVQPTGGSIWTQLVSRLKVETVQILRSPGLVILLLIAIGMTAAFLWGGGNYGAGSYPTVASTIDGVGTNFSLFILIIAAFYGGEAVWRERDAKLNEIVDSAPVPAWVMTLPKIAAVFLVILMVNFAGMLTGLFYQAVMGANEFGIGRYFGWFILPAAVDGLLIAILAVVVQVLSPNKYVGWGIILAWFLGTIVLTSMGYTSPLYIYANTPSVPLSDMVDPAPFAWGAWVMRAYWLAFALLLVLAAHLLWPRGTDNALSSRFRRVKRTGVGLGNGMVAAGAVAAMVGLGLYAQHNFTQLNTYRTSDENEERLADFERKYLKYEDVVQPVVTDVTMRADLYPDDRRLDVDGVYALRNDSDQPIETLHVRANAKDSDTQFDQIDIRGATREMFDEDYGYAIYRFDEPLAPGATSQMRFSGRVHYRGFTSGGPKTNITPDATFLNSAAFTPTIGMNRSGLLSDRQARRRQGLEPELRPAKLEDMSATRENALGLDWVNSDITFSTDADQTPIAPGNKVSDEVEGDRRIARFVSPQPILNFLNLNSGHYAEASRTVGDVTHTVYYHPEHDWNVDRMLDAMEASISYYEENFGPYQFDHARIIEFPRYASFAQAYAGTMPYSESIGFTTDIGENDTDFITYVIAHELAHQYWAHQVVGAGMQGDALTTETMASYSAIMVMKDLLGEDQMRRFLKYELDAYLSGRKGEALEELPLLRMENQAYIHYRKGGHVMALLAHRLGEERVNRAFANFIDQWRFKGAPYHRSIDFVNEVRKVARNEEERRLIEDVFEKIVLFDLSVADATSEQVGDRWRTTITVDAAKYVADGKGVESEVPLDAPIEIGLFADRPGFGQFDEGDVIYLEPRQLTNGRATITLTSARRPAFVGIDPYNRYIDRNSDDNVEAVSES